MAAPSKDFEVDVGTTFALNITGRNADQSAFDFSTGEVRMEFRKDPTASLASLTLNETLGVENNGLSGVIVELSSAQTIALAGVKFYRLLLTVSSKDYVLLKGRVNFIH